MDRSRKATRAGNEVTLQHMSAKAALLVDEFVDEELAHLQASIEKMKHTPELKRRIKAFGECQRTAGESPSQFYDKLRHWLNREIPVTKSPLHPPRQLE